MDYSEILKEEYKKAGAEPIYFELDNGERLLIPAAYQGKKDLFARDIFSYDKEIAKYHRHNAALPKDKKKISPQMMHCGDAIIVAPLDLVLNRYTDEKIIEKACKRANRRYRSTLKKAMRAQKEFPYLRRNISMSDNYITETELLHCKYCATQVAKKLGQTIKFTAQQAAQITAGAAGILPVLAYKLLDKKHHFADSKAKRAFDNKVVPYIYKGALKGTLALALAGGGKFAYDKITAPIEISTVTEKPTPALENKYQINSREDFKKLYEESLQFMAISMFPTEVLVNHAYTDNNKTINTIGLGSYYYPANGDPKSSDWTLTSKYVKANKDLRVDGQKAVDLADGWFRHREGGRIYNNMYQALQNCELCPREFAAIAMTMYNSETAGLELCRFVSKNYTDPVACASKIMSLEPSNKSFRDGIIKRHAHEALIYLNTNDYAYKVPYLMVRPIKSGVYVTSVTQLRPEDCRQARDSMAVGNLDYMSELSNKICNYRCKGGETVAEIAFKNGVGHLCKYNGDAFNLAEENYLQTTKEVYKNALKSYGKGDYSGAMEQFKDLLAHGVDGADIHNDMAITYYNLGEYQKCIDEAKVVLQTGETNAFPAANYNAGKAYEKLGNLNKAKQNYELAQKRNPENTVYQNAVKKVNSQLNAMQARTAGGR